MGSEVKLYFRKAEVEKHPETVVFVHNMLGDHRTTLRHSLLMNELGYNTVSFNLIWGSKHLYPLKHPLALRLPLGVFRIWKKQIRRVFDQVPGPKILFAFSGPSLSAFLACRGRHDIHQVICDGGPFRDFPGNTRNLFDHTLGIKYENVLKTLALAGTYVWGKASENAIDKVLSKWDPNLPILSIRGTADPIVPEKTIADIFSPHPDLPLETLSIHGGKHLDGLKHHPEIYKKRVVEFLAKNSIDNSSARNQDR